MPFPLKLVIASIIFAVTLIPGDALAVIHTASTLEVSTANGKAQPSKKELRKKRRAIRKSIKPASSSIFSNQKFKFGLFVLAFGVGLSLLDLLLAGLGFLGFLGVLGIVAGMVLIVWGILEFIT